MTKEQMQKLQEIANEINENIDFRGKDGEYFRRQMIQECLNNGPQSVHTPFSLCGDMLKKLSECISEDNKSIKDMKIAVLFNVEFVECLISDYGVPPENITFFADSISERMWVQCGYGIEPFGERIFEIGGAIYEYPDKKGKHDSVGYLKKIVKENNMKFDCVVMNPPYQDANNKHSPLWQKFIEKSFDLCSNGGYICSVTPSAWRKPGHYLHNLMFTYDMLYLEIHNQTDGQKTFKAGTRYDWYVLRKQKTENKTNIVDEAGKSEYLNIKKCIMIPHFDIINLLNIVNENIDKLQIIHNRTNYGNDKPWMNKEKTEEFKYPCVYATSSSGVKFLYSSTNKNGHFGIPKIILGKASPQNAIYDEAGNYGVTNNCIAIVCDKKEAEHILEAMKTEQFADFIKATKFSGFSIEPEIFENMSKDFWKEFV